MEPERSRVAGHQVVLEGAVDVDGVGWQRRPQSGKVLGHKLPAVDQLRAIHLDLGKEQKRPSVTKKKVGPVMTLQENRASPSWLCRI